MKRATLTAITLENFKAFGKPARVPLAPITLLFGENSAGKSTILQALYLLKQTRELAPPDVPLLLRAENGYVDLGSFEEMVHGHDTHRELSIRFDVEGDPKLVPVREEISDVLPRRVGMRFRFAKGEGRTGPRLSGFDVFARTPHFIERKGTLESVGIHCHKEPLIAYSSAIFDDPHFGSRVGLKITRLPSDPCYWRKALRFLEIELKSESVNIEQERRHELYRKLLESTRLPMPGDARISQHDEDVKLLLLEHYTLREGFEPWLTPSEVLSNATPEDLHSAIQEAWQLRKARETVMKWIETVNYGLIEYLKHFVPSPVAYTRELIDSRQYEEICLHRGLDGWEIEEDQWFEAARYVGQIWTKELIPSLDLKGITYGVAYLVDSACSVRIIPFEPLRAAPRRLYPTSGLKVEDVGTKGELLGDFLAQRKGVTKRVNTWLRRLGIDYSVSIKPIRTSTSQLFEIRLRDTRQRNAKTVNIADVGSGIAQILPFLAQSLAEEGALITIEQPELHIHPRLQAELGSLFAEGVKKGNRFIIETHSEHLILRLQKLIRTGELKPDDVAVVYVARGSEGSTVEQLRLDEEGDFIDDWPGGFFPERLKELEDE
ncbi:MAG: DUF3696 domain-containing protein [Candidatus Hydrogenedentales bacterium]|jgi:predicted ATPase